MIELSLDVDQVFEQQESRVCIRVKNHYNRTCTAIFFDLDFPAGLLVIRGQKSIEIASLAAGETQPLPYQLRARQAGAYAIQVHGFSFRDPNGVIRRIGDQKLDLYCAPRAGAGETDAPRFEVSLINELTVGQWCSLKVHVRNLSDVTRKGLMLHLKGPLECEQAALAPLPVGDSTSIDLSVKPLESGERVPVEVLLLAPSKAVVFSRRAYLLVSRPVESPAPLIHIEHGKDLSINYGTQNRKPSHEPPSAAREAGEGNRSNLMEPITLIVTALVAGLSTGLSTGVADTARTAVKDLYTAFKNRLQKSVGDNEDAQLALISVEKKPDSEGRQVVLKEALSELKMDLDEELLNLAKSFLEAIDEQGAKAGKYNITIQNAQGIVIGDHANVTQHIAKQ